MESEEQVERKAGLEIGPQLATPLELVDDPSHPFSSAGDEALPCEVDRGLAWVRVLFERIDVDSRDEKAVAVWKATADERVSRLDSVYEWLRRAGPSRLLIGEPPAEIAMARSSATRASLATATVECNRCHRVIALASPVQRHCPDCRRELKLARSRETVHRRRAEL